MSSEAHPERRAPGEWSWFRSLPVRLTFYYAVVLLLALGVCYGVSYWRISSLVSERVDAYLTTEADECRHFFDLKGLPAVVQEANAESQAEGSRDVYFRVIDAKGATQFETSSATLAEETGLVSPAVQRPFSVAGKSTPARVIVQPLSPQLSLMIVASMESDYRLVSKSMSLILAVMAATWLCGCAIGILITRHSLRGISAVTGAAIAIADGDISRRVPRSSRRDEIDRLAAAFNTMAHRIERLLGNLRETNDSLAHELRSPLTRMRSRCELSLLKDGQDPVSAALAQDLIEQIDQLLGTINAILDMSAYQAGRKAASALPVDMRKVLQDACDLFLPVAEDRSLSLQWTAREPLLVMGNCDQLQRLLSNLVDNAVKYTHEGGKVTVEGRTHNGWVQIMVADSGVGIAPDELPKVFNRFFRGRNGLKHAGNGLGLSLAQIIATSHGGGIRVESRPHLGTTFTLELPLWPARGGAGAVADSAERHWATDVDNM